MDLSKHPAVTSFITTLPPETWSRDEMEEWLGVFRGVLISVYALPTNQEKIPASKDPEGKEK